MVKSVTLDLFNSKIVLGTVVGTETEYTVQEIGSLIKEQLQLSPFIDNDKVFRWSGFDELPAGDRTGVVMILQDSWKLSAADQGADHLMRVSRGIISRHDNTNPVDLGVVNIYWVFADSTVSSLANAQTLEDLQQQVESQNRSKAAGNVFYCDPINGDDANDGTKIGQAVKLVNVAIGLCTAGNNDLILIRSPNTTGQILIQENIVMDKDEVHIRGLGIRTDIHPTSGISVLISGNDCELSDVEIEGANTGTSDCVVITGDQCILEDVEVINSNGIAIKMTGSDNSFFDHIFVSEAATIGIEINDSTFLEINNSHIMESGTDNIKTTASTPGATDHMLLEEVSIHGGAGWGINNGVNVLDLMINPVCNITGGVGRLLDNGSDTLDNEIFNAVQTLVTNTHTGSAGGSGRTMSK